MVSVVPVVQVGVSVVAIAVVGKTMAVVGIPVVVVGIGISFRSSGSSGLGISGPLAILVAIETSIGESMDGGHNRGMSSHKRGMSHKRVAIVATIMGIGISSGLGISRPFAIEVSKVVSKVAGIGKTKSMAIDKRVSVVAGYFG